MIERQYKDYGATTYMVGGVEVPSVSSIVTRWHSYGMERYKLRLAVEQAKKWPGWETDKIISVAMRDAGDAARHGTYVHSLTEQFDLGNAPKDHFQASINETWNELLDMAGLTVVDTEQLVAQPGRYAGRFDRTVLHPVDGLCVLDLKTGKDMSIQYLLQLAAYGSASHVVMDDGSIEPREFPTSRSVAYILSIPRTGGRPKLFRADLTGAWQAFGHLLELHSFETARLHENKPWKEVKPEPVVISVETVEEVFGDVETIDALEDYRARSWQWLREVAQGYSAPMKDRLVKLWNTEQEFAGLKGINTFKKVAGGAPLPTLHEIEKVELVMCEIDSEFKIPFRDITTRPLPPHGYSVEEVPPVHFRVDVAPAGDIALVHQQWLKLPLKDRRSYKGVKKNNKPHILTRTDLAYVKAAIEAALLPTPATPQADPEE